MKRVAILASGGGTNAAAVYAYLAALPEPQPAMVSLVASDKPDSGALAKAAAAGIATATLPDPADGAALVALLEAHRTDLVVLAGYLKLVSVQATARYAGAMVNVHPALLPMHGGPGMYGLRVHRAVLASGAAESGATVHFVDARYDRGAPIAWARVPVDAADTPESLAARVLVGEHFVLPRVVHALAIGAVQLGGAGAVIVGATARPLFNHPPAGVTIRLAG